MFYETLRSSWCMFSNFGGKKIKGVRVFLEEKIFFLNLFFVFPYHMQIPTMHRFEFFFTIFLSNLEIELSESDDT